MGYNYGDRWDKYQKRKEKREEEEAAAQKERVAKLQQKLNVFRQRVGESPSSADLHYQLAIQLLSTVPHFSDLQTGGAEFWERFRDASREGSWSKEGGLPAANVYAEASEAEEHFNLALGLGLADPLDRAKSYFLLYLLICQYSTFLGTKRYPGTERERELVNNVIAETKKYLRLQPHHLEALQMQSAAYYWIANKKGMGKTEQAIRQAQALAKAGVLSPEGGSSSEDKKSSFAKGQELEEKVRALLQAMGLTAATTQATADGGIDVEAYSTDPIYAGKYLIQCKNWGNPVGESVVRDLYGVVMAENANKGVLVTTGRFTAAAETFAQNKQLELIDGSTLQAILRKHGLL